ncbi:Methyltransferase domain-containing protein [Cyclobacterium lianum]|uniref:Methyltransferase domain-containing protein n=1 Tax=Cyclobacterium lianum TaxID=388280 RepID=A0A1M7QHB7_9BACT|nr:class I SAM-dependent methyltransferase [Cyclobacterium lianum]SHN30410.1 Methyltransferase domain-containing protein [Cyclobacterium lianum]
MLFHFWEYLIYFLRKEDSHSIHSPFFYKLYRNLQSYLKEHRKGDAAIEASRYNFLRSTERIPVTDYGAGSRWMRRRERRVSSIMKIAGTPLKFSLVYSFFCRQTPGMTALDLGGSLGINTAYLCKEVKGILYSFEGDPALLGLAQSHLHRFPSAQLIEGNLDESLYPILERLRSIDFVLMDANHRYKPTMAYFNAILPRLHAKSIVVIADIHWSCEMKRAWQEISSGPHIRAYIDLFDCGILFFQPSAYKQQYVWEI